MIGLLALHFLAAALAPVLTRRLDRRAFLVLALVPAASFAWLLGPTLDVTSGGAAHTEHLTWISSIGMDIDLALTPLTAIMSLVVTGVGALVVAYCAWYFRPGDPEIWRFSAVLTGFAGSMLGLVVSDNLYVLFVFWELTTILSFLLIGHNPERKANRRAAMNALLVTTFGGLVMLIGLFILDIEAGTARISEILIDPPSGTATTWAILLVLVGAVSKSALVPFHFWLPGAMAAPTPVSAYLHAAAMVKAGVFLIALLAPAFADVPGWRPLLITLGIVTMILGGLRALRQHDTKLLLAYGTVSQLGFLAAVAGAGTRSAAFAGLALILGHALFKSALFLIVGVIDRTAGTRDLRELTGLYRRMPVLFAAAVVAAGSMAGLPPLLGFTAKEAALAAFVDLGEDAGIGVWGTFALIGITVGSILTVAYTARFLWGAFGVRDVQAPTLKALPVGFVAAPVVLAALSLVGGFLGGPLTPRIMSYAGQEPAGAHAPVLTLWHGFTPALALSVVAVTAGIWLWVVRKRVADLQQRLVHRLHLPDAELVYHDILRGVDRFSIELTGRTQRGSLPVYVAIMLITFVVVPGLALATAWEGVALRRPDSWLQVAVVTLIIVAAVMTVRSRRRLRAVLLLGVTGYGTALLFVIHGAPDLALTQTLVETFAVVTFVLVLRRLPPFFSDRPFTFGRWLRIGLGTVVGVAVGAYTLIASSVRTADPVGREFAEPAYAFGGGENIVNITLVDIRVWDTFGELAVLVVAATGVASLIFLLTDRATSHREARRDRRQEVAAEGWMQGARLVADRRRSVMLEVVSRAIFPVIMVFSVYLMLAGHYDPGGGFAGGLVAGLALMVRYLAGGRSELDSAAPVDAGTVLGSGLVVAAMSGLIPALAGYNAFQSGSLDIPVPLLGDLHIVTSLFFDVGVYLIVVGLALDVLRSLGGGIDKHAEEPAMVEAVDP
ncbi:Na+/H+ antiporter subunit A [Aeromicrobium sp. CTD01-1L150]|uniref:Na+/H+ antiporter subunit A n=1 Tax=Aeromicrobium sp. CTD01-1L150 TaxID=3341830 RepID=UPI0035BF04D8